MSGNLVAQLRAAREIWLDLEGDGRRVRLIRPAEAEMSLLSKSTAFEIAAKFATGWEGFTEAHLLGAAVGADDPVAFFPELWTEVVRDNADWAVACVERLVQAVEQHTAAKVDTAKN